jgi:Arc-like DNA binding domain
MKKDSQFTFRIPSDLKVRLEEIALAEGRSVAQICVALLHEGIESHKKQGPAFVQHMLSQQKKNSCDFVVAHTRHSWTNPGRTLAWSEDPRVF